MSKHVKKKCKSIFFLILESEIIKLDNKNKLFTMYIKYINKMQGMPCSDVLCILCMFFYLISSYCNFIALRRSEVISSSLCVE